ALEIAEALVRSGAVDIIVIDSVAALVTKAEIEGEMGDSHVGQLARLMSQAMRKLTAALSRANCSAIFINQLRDKIGVLYGSSETTTGGRALKFYASVRIDIRKIETLKNNGEMVGSRTRAKIVKNKVAPPFREAEFDVMYGKGISHTGELVDLGLKFEVLKRSGAWFYYGEERLGQGRDNVKLLLEENKELAQEIEEKIMACYREATTPKSDKTVDNEPVLMPVDAEPPVSHARVNIDIAVDD
ncbi:MAG: recombinase RecA, partial [Clostridia bacterium]|nr:recombinase RecA [Clostridia bacterium]